MTAPTFFTTRACGVWRGACRAAISKVLLPLFGIVATGFGIVATGCGRASLVRVAHPEEGQGPPVIERLVDLGGLPLPAEGQISQTDSDGALTPGEWIAVVGRNLSTKPTLQIDGKPTLVTGYLRGGSLLFRLPRGLSPRVRHRLDIQTALGASAIDFGIVSHVIVADTDGKSLRFVPIRHNTKTLFEQGPLDVDVKEAFCHALSLDGSLLYALQRGAEGTGTDGKAQTTSKIVIVHMGAPSGPAEVGAFSVTTPSAPTRLTMVDEGILAILAERHLTIVDVSNPTQGRVAATVSLPVPMPTEAGTNKAQPVQYDDIVVLPQPRTALVLEVYGNTVTAVDLDNPRAPRVGGTLRLAGRPGVPWSIDIAPDPDDARAAWVLQGPNFRIVSAFADNVLESVRSKAESLVSSALGTADKMTAGTMAADKVAVDKVAVDKAAADKAAADKAAVVPSGVRPSSADQPDRGLGRVVRIRAEVDGLRVVQEKQLPPDFYPFFVLPKTGNQQLVSGVNGHVFRFGKISPSLDGLGQVVSVLTDSVQLGRVLGIRKDGAFESVVQGVSLYFGLGTMPDGTVVYSVLRPGVRALPPSMTAEWGIEAVEQGFASVKTLSWRAMIPPYTLGLFEVQ